MEARSLIHPVDRAMRSCNLLRTRLTTLRPFSTTLPRTQDMPESTSLPRWQQTPPRMRMPFRVRPPPKQSVFNVNSDPAKLDAMYVRLLGPGGDVFLPEEVKWLAVTHKSFEHGARGSNDRLAFLGKRIVDLQSSLALLRMPRYRGFEDDADAGEELTPLSGLVNLTADAKQKTLDKRRVASLARDRGVQEVMRWKPRKADNLMSSGVETVLAHTLYSIIGAVSLQRGGEAANMIVKEKVLAPLGLRS